MIEQNRPLRKVAIPDHLWDSLAQMAQDMGSDREALVCQALFMFARLNGYLAPGVAHAPSTPFRPGPVAAPTVIPRRGSAQDLPAQSAGEQMPEAPAPALRRQSSAVPRPPSELPDDLVRREVAERVLETAAELERMMKDKNSDPARDLATRDAQAREGTGRDLYLAAEDGSLEKVLKDRFVIGRGKHCDLVINSGKVSREHAAIIHEAGDHFIEDLGSSNGTWFSKQRIRRRKIEDGDEYFICSEKVKCVLR